MLPSSPVALLRMQVNRIDPRAYCANKLERAEE